MYTYITKPGQHWATRTECGVLLMHLHIALVDAVRYPLPPWKRRVKLPYRLTRTEET